MSTDLFVQFVGRWRGTGHAEHPTVESFDYNDTLTVISSPSPTLLQYERRIIMPYGIQIELGFMHLQDDGSINVTNVISGGRIEVLAGALEAEEDSVLMRLHHKLVGNDDLISGVTWTLRLSGNSLDSQHHTFMVSLPEMPAKMSTHYHRIPFLMT